MSQVAGPRFAGSFTHSLDTAGRFVMPVQFRYSLGLKFFITKGIGCLCALTTEAARELEERLSDLGSLLTVMLDPNVGRLTRHFFSGMVEASSENKQFRVQLTPEQRRYAGIANEVVIRGCGPFIEIWSPEALAKYESENEKPEDLMRAYEAVLKGLCNRNAGGEDAGVPSPGSA